MPKKTKFGPRSKTSLLPHQIRYRIYSLLLDGATFQAVQQDSIIADALDQAGFQLTSRNLTSVRRCKEYKEFAVMRSRQLADRQTAMMQAEALRDSGALESMADQARIRLMDILADILTRDDLEDNRQITAVLRLSQSIASLGKQNRDKKIQHLEARIRDLRLHNAELKAEIDRLKRAPDAVFPGLSESAIQEAEEKLKLL